MAPETLERLEILIENLEFLLAVGEDPERSAKRVGSTPAALAKKMREAGRPDLAAPFNRVVKRESTRRKQERAE